MIESSHKARRPPRPITTAALDIPGSLAVAVRNAIRCGARLFPGFHEAIGRRLGVSDSAIYKLCERLDQKITTEHIDAVIDCGGGDVIEAYIRARNIAAKGFDDDGRALLVAGTNLAVEAAQFNAMIAKEIGPDGDTPGRIDPSEAAKLIKYMEKMGAECNWIRTRLERIAG